MNTRDHLARLISALSEAVEFAGSTDRTDHNAGMWDAAIKEARQALRPTKYGRDRFYGSHDSPLDLDYLERFVEDAAYQYNDSAPALAHYLSALYLRIIEDWESISLAELNAVARLVNPDGSWERPNFAQNRIYKALDRLGRLPADWLSY